ncbi:hypothetical protein [Halococcoides cellulosivorans]|uniref:Uncharacterized protein n=1 Tax=Halococcoides cellulosivorans TaxID=1679096 RepID=A0A2R4X061_9EURY|nr:hypothetical protein [Halococcoides cellulosivorans]AWB27163.1 hypothetical protein HARCEL1_05305 [Halococcoides cellulosivorans]
MGLSETYSAVFAPEQMVVLGLTVMALVEANASDAEPIETVGRVVTVVLGAGVTVGVIAATPELLVGESAGDLQASLALLVGLAVIVAVWQSRDWGDHVLWACLTLGAVTVVHTAIVPFWNLSGHVLFSMTPLGLVALADRRAVVLVVIPLLMMPARVGAGVHTPLETVGGLTLALLALAVLAHHRPEFRQSLPV